MALQAGLAALESHEFPFADLPADRSDPLWPQIAAECGLSLVQLSALKNERCKTVVVAPPPSSSVSSPPPSTVTVAPHILEAKRVAPTTALETYTEEESKRIAACGDALQGYLFKTGGGLMGASYKKRFVLLSNQIVQYFSDDTRNVLKGEIFLRPESVVIKTKEATHPFAFDLTPVAGGRIYHFAGKDAAERDGWVQAIQAAIDHCEDARKQLCLVGNNLRRLQKNRQDDLPFGTPALVAQVSSLSHGTLLIKCKGEWEEQEWRIDDDKLVFPEAGIRYALGGVSFKVMPEQEHGVGVLGLKRSTDGHGLLLKSQTRPRLKRLIFALRAHATFLGDELSDADDEDI